MQNKAKSTCQNTAFATATMFVVFFAAQTQIFAQTDWLKNPNRDLMGAVNGYELNAAAAKDALERGADINWKNDAMGGETILIMEIKSFQKPEAIKFLLENGADPNIKDDAGRTALSWARQRLSNNRAGREIIALLEAATGQKAAATKTPSTTPDARTETPDKPAPSKTTATATTKKPRRTGGAPSVEEVKETIEKSFTGIYQNHFFGVKNEVTFEWSGAITIGAIQTVRSAPKPCYPVKLKVKVTAEDPRDGNRSTVARGQEANIGGFLKNEIFCFYRDGLGEWAYGTYEK